MKPQDIRPGTRLELELLSRDGRKIGNTHISQLLEIRKDASMVIAAPIFETRLIYVPAQAQISLNLVHPRLGLIGFTATVIDKDDRGKVAVLIIQPESEVDRIQRRGHFRLDHLEKALIWVCGEDDRQDKNAAAKATTKNISGSGLCIVTERDIPKAAEVEIEFNLNASTVIHAKCTVMRNKSVEIKEIKHFELGLHFTRLPIKEEDSIIKYIFERQRTQLKI